MKLLVLSWTEDRALAGVLVAQHNYTFCGTTEQIRDKLEELKPREHMISAIDVVPAVPYAHVWQTEEGEHKCYSNGVVLEPRHEYKDCPMTRDLHDIPEDLKAHYRDNKWDKFLEENQ